MVPVLNTHTLLLNLTRKGWLSLVYMMVSPDGSPYTQTGVFEPRCGHECFIRAFVLCRNNASFAMCWFLAVQPI